MFETILSEISNVLRNTVRAIESAVRREPLLAMGALIALLFIIF